MYTRGKFGIEYTPSDPKPAMPGIGRVIFLVALVAVFFVVRAVWLRLAARNSEGAREAPLTSVPREEASAPKTNASPTVVVKNVDCSNRPLKIRNLLLRLAEAERLHDLEMCVSTIEQLRATPGAADLDDALARQLGILNFERLFERKSAQWTTVVKVARGDSATRIAYEHGSTLASLARLNGGAIDHLKVGQHLTVMNHPRFNLVISRRTRTADLLLNGKFFKRYYLMEEVKGAEGSYATPDRFRNFCTEHGVPFKPLDRAELEMLLPKGTPAFIREI